MTEAMLKQLNHQFTAEMQSAFIYLHMSTLAEEAGFEGIACWLMHQYEEELEHAHKFRKYIMSRGGRPLLGTVQLVNGNYNSPKQMFESALNHEVSITKGIYDINKLAQEEHDIATEQFISWFIEEQVEEEDVFKKIINKFNAAGPGNEYFIDHELAHRVEKKEV